MKKYIVEKFSQQPLADIAYHATVNGIERATVNRMPFHCAIHKIDIKENQIQYSLLHDHDDHDELNIIINDNGHELLYLFVVGEDEFELAAPACVWIPAKMHHNANVVKGKGTFVCMRFPVESLQPSELAD